MEKTEEFLPTPPKAKEFDEGHLSADIIAALCSWIDECGVENVVLALEQALMLRVMRTEDTLIANKGCRLHLNDYYIHRYCNEVIDAARIKIKDFIDLQKRNQHCLRAAKVDKIEE